jgi:hypothetical protein
MAYWINIFDNYIKNNKKYKIFKKADEKYIIFDNTKYKLYNNIFKWQNNIAYQLYKLSTSKIIIDNIIYNIENNINLKINDNIYEEDIITKISLDSINFLPVSHNIKVKSILNNNKYYNVELYSDIPNEYLDKYNILYINKEKIDDNNDIMKYLIVNKLIGSIS